MECVCETGGNGQVVVVFIVGKCNLILLDIQMLVINVFGHAYDPWKREGEHPPA